MYFFGKWKYFDFEEILLMDEKETEKLARERNILYAVQPHGVMSVCGLAAGIHVFTRDYITSCHLL